MLTTAEKIKVIMKRNNFTMTELANQLNCSRQNLSNKMSRNNFDEREIVKQVKRLNYNKPGITLLAGYVSCNDE